MKLKVQALPKPLDYLVLEDASNAKQDCTSGKTRVMKMKPYDEYNNELVELSTGDAALSYDPNLQSTPKSTFSGTKFLNVNLNCKQAGLMNIRAKQFRLNKQGEKVPVH